MERILLIGGAMVAVGIAMGAVFLLIARYKTTFEVLEDSVVRWLGNV